MDHGSFGGHDGGSHHGGALGGHHHPHGHQDTGPLLGSYGAENGSRPDADSGRPYGGRGTSSPWAAPVAVAVVALFLIVLAFLAS